MSRIIMLLSNGFKPDPRVAHEAGALVDLGHEVIVLCWDREGAYAAREEIDGYRVERIQTVRAAYGAGARQLVRIPAFWRAAIARALALRPDVIHCHDLDTLPAGWWLKQRYGLPLVYDAHEDYARLMAFYLPRVMTWALAFLERRLLKRVDATISASSAFAEKLREQGVRPLVVLGNYPVLAPFEAVSDEMAQQVRSALGVGPDVFVLVYIGGFSRTRQLQPLLDAAASLSDVQIFIWGDGHQRPQVEAAAGQYANVHYKGWLPADQVPVHFAAADAVYYCLIPGYPGWPNTLSNAMAAGRPIIANDVGDLGRIIREMGCGVLVDTVTPGTIAGAVGVLRDNATRLHMGEAGRRATRERFNWDVAEQQLAQVYAGVLGDAGRIGENTPGGERTV
ncbi:MAG: glycosyltransferase family 4 protein [Anaerolineae bacterium]|nr:glycosyltransferase family 4 protein [Anaerolineae bacterium]